MRLTLHQLNILKVVADTGSISGAAQQLHLTAPTISIQLGQLAETLGTPLHEVIGRRLRLTAAGQDALEAARRIDDELRLLEQRLAARQGVERGRLSIAAVSTAEYLLPNLLGRFQQAHPGIQATLTIVPRERLLARLADGLDDAYLMTRPPGDKELVSEALGRNPLVMIAHPDHPWVQRPDLTLEAVSGERFLVREPGSGTRQWTAEWLARFGAELRPALELGSNETIKQAVMGGHGLAVISLKAVLLELESGLLRLVKLPHFPVPVRWHLVRRRQRLLTPATASFRQHLLDWLPQLDELLATTLSRHGQPWSSDDEHLLDSTPARIEVD